MSAADPMSGSLHQAVVEDFTFQSGINWGQSQIKNWLRHITIDDPPTTQTNVKRDLRTLWTEFLGPFFDGEGPYVRLDDRGKLAPLLVLLHNVPIRIYSPHCAFAAVLTLVLPQPPSTVSNIDYTSCVVALLGRWAKHISPDLFPVVVSVVYTPDGLIVLPDASPAPEAQIVPGVSTIISTSEVQIMLPNAIHTPEAQIVLPDASPAPEAQIVQGVTTVVSAPEAQTILPDVAAVAPTPEAQIVLSPAPEAQTVPGVTTSRAPEAQVVPGATTTTSAPEAQTILPDVAAVAPMPEAQIVLLHAIHTPEAQVMLPDASRLLFVCGTTKVGEATLKEVWGKERIADLNNIVGRHPLNASTASKIPSSIPGLEKLKTMLVSLFGADSDEGKILGRYRDLVEELISTRVLPAWNNRGRRQQGTQSLGDCAETWGLTVMGSILPKGSAIISLSMHQEEINKITEITDEYTILPSTELKLACYNCLYLFTVLEIKCEITVTDAAWDQRKTAQDLKGQNAQTGSEVASMEGP